MAYPTQRCQRETHYCIPDFTQDPDLSKNIKIDLISVTRAWEKQEEEKKKFKTTTDKMFTALQILHQRIKDQDLSSLSLTNKNASLSLVKDKDHAIPQFFPLAKWCGECGHCYFSNVLYQFEDDKTAIRFDSYNIHALLKHKDTIFTVILAHPDEFDSILTDLLPES